MHTTKLVKGEEGKTQKTTETDTDEDGGIINLWSAEVPIGQNFQHCPANLQIDTQDRI